MLTFRKKLRKFKVSKKEPHFLNPQTQNYEVSGTNLKLFNYLRSNKINVNPKG